MARVQAFHCEGVDAGVCAETSFDVEAAIVRFLADPALASLVLPHMGVVQQKHATVLVDSCPKIKCEICGFGSEQRVRLSKVGEEGIPIRDNSVQSLFQRMQRQCPSESKDNQGIDMPCFSRSARSRSTSASRASSSGDASTRKLSKMSSSSKSTDDEALSEPPDVVQMRGTYVHVDGVGLVDQRFWPSASRLVDHCQVQNASLHAEGTRPADDRDTLSMHQHLLEGTPCGSALASANKMGDASTRRAPTSGTDASARKAPAPIAAAAAAVAAAVVAEVRQMPAGTSALTPIASPPQRWALGTEVVIEGLAKFPAFNGRRGVVCSVDSASGRYDIRLALPAAGHKWAKVKSENIRLVNSPWPPSSIELSARPSDLSSVVKHPVRGIRSSSPQRLHLSELL